MTLLARLRSLLTAAALVGAVSPAVFAADTSEAPVVQKAAVFVSNRADPALDPKIPVLEDFLSSRVTSLGFSVLTREVVVDSLKAFDPAVASAPRPADSLEARLTEQSSALRLAQNLGVDVILQASISGMSSRDRKVAAYGVEQTNEEITLRVAYKILDAAHGGTLAGDTVKVVSTQQQTSASSTETAGLIDDLLDEASVKIVANLKTKIAQGKVAPTGAKAALVGVTIRLEAADLMIPDVRVGDENTVTISESKFKVSPLGATVEVDGVAVGSAPGTVQLRPGFSKLRITREGFRPWERTINAVQGQVLTVALQMSDEGYARWKDATAFINNLKNQAKLTDGEVKVLEGYGKMLSESFYKVDTDENVKVILPGVLN